MLPGNTVFTVMLKEDIITNIISPVSAKVDKKMFWLVKMTLGQKTVVYFSKGKIAVHGQW